MGTHYSSITISGFSESPPSDDGLVTENNKVKWSTIKTKLATPLKTAIEAINTDLVNAFDYSPLIVVSAYTTVEADNRRTVEVSSAVTTTFTISLGDAATMTNNYIVTVRNNSSVSQTVGRATVGNTIDGAAANKTIPAGASATFAVNDAETGYYTVAEAGYSIPTSLIDAKGDILVGTAADTAGRLAVGSNNLALVADSSQTAGMRWGSAQHWPLVSALRSQGATFTVTSAHRGNLIFANVDSGGNLTIDADASGLGDGFVFAVQDVNTTAGSVIIDDSTAASNFFTPQGWGSNAVTLATLGDCVILQSDGASWRAIAYAVKSTTSYSGILPLASNAEALGGSDAGKAVTSAGLASSKSLGTNGYMKLPGGLILQWFTGTATAGGNRVNFPVAFNTLYSIPGGFVSSGFSRIYSISADNSGFTAVADGTVDFGGWAVGV